jgi:CheY-like chemotaxis protein
MYSQILFYILVCPSMKTPHPDFYRPDPIRLNILLAEDDEDDFLLFSEAAAELSLGIKIKNVTDGVALMEYLRNKDILLPDIIFLDLNMPCKNGLECLAEIKSDKYLHDIPLIIFTSSAHQKDIDDAYRLGANLYINKPNSFAGLSQVINSLTLHTKSELLSNREKSDFVWNFTRNIIFRESFR